MSDADNHAGGRWLQIVSKELDSSDFGIICVTRANLGSVWAEFRSRRLSKAIEKARVSPLLYGFTSPSDLQPPLGQFQAKVLDAWASGIQSRKSTNCRDVPLAK
jgi:hypothetical protein